MIEPGGRRLSPRWKDKGQDQDKEHRHRCQEIGRYGSRLRYKHNCQWSSGPKFGIGDTGERGGAMVTIYDDDEWERQ